MQSSSNQTSCLSLSRFHCSSRNSSVSSFIPCRTLYRESKLFLCHRLNAGFQWRKTVLEAQWRIRDNSFLRRKFNRIERICTRFVCYSAKKSGTTGQKSLALEINGSSFLSKSKLSRWETVINPQRYCYFIVLRCSIAMKIPSPFISLPRTLR